jgi:hypothetical protein
MDKLQIIIALNALTRLAIRSNIAVERFNAHVRQAEAEGRSLTDAELAEFAGRAQEAIDRLQD